MTNARLTTEEAQGFLDANPAVQWIDTFVFDMSGIKRIRRPDLLGGAKNGIMMPTSVFIMDTLGNCVEETGRLWETGDLDHQCDLLSRTLVPIPVSDGRHAQAVMVIDARDELDPHTVLVGQVERYARAGQRPVAADDPSRPLTFGFEEVDTLSPFTDDIYRISEVQGRPVDTVMQESCPGQSEINLKPRADTVAVALDGLLLKRAVKAAARAHQLETTLMAKPHHDGRNAPRGFHGRLGLELGRAPVLTAHVPRRET
jgi:glutamine synthetase